MLTYAIPGLHQQPTYADLKSSSDMYVRCWFHVKSPTDSHEKIQSLDHRSRAAWCSWASFGDSSSAFCSTWRSGYVRPTFNSQSLSNPTQYNHDGLHVQTWALRLLDQAHIFRERPFGYFSWAHFYTVGREPILTLRISARWTMQESFGNRPHLLPGAFQLPQSA